ncbi:hypothetical protein [Acinetobacter pittii]|uniref:hypothetical protein n=1 Tax=Acinetobacter pittii TaxID=48296 RepID=UPI00192B539A|nr:hypothetical protein [Acinetobacter pittii]
MATNWNAVLANINNASDILAILRKVLGLLDGKVDLTKIDEIITDISNMQTNVDTALTNVNSALSDFDTEAQEAIQQVIAAGLMEGFATEAELLTTRPLEAKKYAKAEDTDVIWFWNKPEGSPEGNYWTSTGLSELAQSKIYTNQQILDKVLKYIQSSGKVHNVFSLLDLIGNSLLRFSNDGGLYIFGQDESVQNKFLSMGIDLKILNQFKEIISKISFYGNSDDILRLTASDGMPLVRIKEDSGLYLHGDSESIQEKFKQLFESIYELKSGDLGLLTKPTSFIIRLDDSLGNPLLRFDDQSKAYFFGMSESIQDLLAKITEPKSVYIPLYAKNPDYLNKKFFLNDAFVERLNHARMMCTDVAPVPNFMTKQKFAIGNNWVNDVTLEVLNPTDRVPMDGYQYVFTKDIGVVHPQVWVFNEAVAGYKYWLSINPYTNGNDQLELPFIYGSNDPEFRSWELIPEFPTPFEIDPIDEDGSYRGHLSDSGFTYDVKNGDLIFFWRKNLYYAEGSPISAKVGVSGARFNGKRWSEKHQIYGLRTNPDAGVTEELLSPNIVYNPSDDLYYMYSTQFGKLWYRTSNDLTGDHWSDRTECILNNHSGSLWHLDAKFIGDKLVILLHQDNFMSSSTDALYFAISSDFVNFNVSANSILTEVDPPIYKATFQPIFTGENTAKFRVIYTSDARTTPQYQMYVTDTNEFNIGV